jgi:hypothetical protein
MVSVSRATQNVSASCVCRPLTMTRLTRTGRTGRAAVFFDWSQTVRPNCCNDLANGFA